MGTVYGKEQPQKPYGKGRNNQENNTTEDNMIEMSNTFKRTNQSRGQVNSRNEKAKAG